MAQQTITDSSPLSVKNITESQFEESLLIGGALQNAIFNSANFSCIATDAKGVIQIFNVGAQRMLGYTADEVVNKITPSDLHDPQELAARATALSVELGTPIKPGFEALVFKASRGIEDIYEVTKVRKDGSRFPEVLSVTALRDAQDTIIGYLLIGTDNTARLLAEDARRSSEARYRTLFEYAPEGIIISDPRAYYIDANASMCRMLGYARDELIGLHASDIVAQAEIKHIEPALKTINSGSDYRRQWQLRRKDGSVFDADVIATQMPDGNVLGMVGDITDRKSADQQTANALRELSDVKAAIDQHAIVAITDSKGKITYVNDKFCDISKYPREELLGQDHRIINSDFHPKEFIRSIWQTISDGRVWKGEIKNKAKDGTFYWVDTTIVPYLGAKGKPIQYIAIRADITGRKHFEQALQQTNVQLENAKSTAEKANLAKSDFLSSMSHELRSPLNAILGFAQLMESASPEPTATQAARIAQILQAGWYLLNLINEILDLAVIESGTVPLSKESVSLPELMSECRAMMEPQAQQRDIRMTFPRFDTPMFVRADRTRVKQILVNLLSNAIKYNREQGTVVVECTVSAPERIRFSVKDTGAGLPPEKLAHLFQPFNRLGQEVGSVAGTGIGLVVSKRLAELMEGVLGVESTVGVGSVFWCELISATPSQLKVQDSDAAATVPQQLPGDAPRRTLIYIEDNPANMMLVEQLIEERCPHIRLVTAVNGTLGIELARATEPTVILMDINLPGISGIKALKILREDPATAHIPVVALSANAMARDVAKGLEAGFFRYLTKPIKVKEFVDTLNAAMECAEKTVPQIA
jgi:PAS domain S-box-containing protein